MPDESQEGLWWVGGVMIGLLLASVAVGLVAFLMNREAQLRIRRDADLLADDMDSIYEPHRPVVNGEAKKPPVDDPELAAWT